jgi:hypothetical protein
MQRDLIKCNVLWKGSPISVVKTFGKSTCALCNRERMEIAERSPNYLSIFVLEIHGACPLKPRFHRYHQHKPSADELKKHLPQSQKPKEEEEELIQMGMRS